MRYSVGPELLSVQGMFLHMPSKWPRCALQPPLKRIRVKAPTSQNIQHWLDLRDTTFLQDLAGNSFNGQTMLFCLATLLYGVEMQ